MNRKLAAILPAVAMVVTTAGCDRPDLNPAGAPSVQPDIRNYVTGAAAAALNGSGSLALPAAKAPDDVPIISAERARELAVAFVRTYGRSHRMGWTAQRGRSFDAGSLQVLPRVYYAASPHGRLPDGYHGAYRRMLGPWYLVHFSAGKEIVLGVAISAYSSDLEIRDGLIHEPVEGGTYYISSAVAAEPTVRAPYVPVSPEEAVAAVGSATGARVTAVPGLATRNAAWHPLFAQWKLVLDRSVRVQRTHRGGAPGEVAAVRELYVGPGNTLFVPARVQPPSVRIPVETHQGGPTSPPRQVVVEVPTRPGMATEFEEVSLVQGGD